MSEYFELLVMAGVVILILSAGASLGMTLTEPIYSPHSDCRVLDKDGDTYADRWKKVEDGLYEDYFPDHHVSKDSELTYACPWGNFTETSKDVHGKYRFNETFREEIRQWAEERSP